MWRTHPARLLLIGGAGVPPASLGPWARGQGQGPVASPTPQFGYPASTVLGPNTAANARAPRACPQARRLAFQSLELRAMLNVAPTAISDS